MRSIVERCATPVREFVRRFFTPYDNYAHFDFSYGTPIALDANLDEGAR